MHKNTEHGHIVFHSLEKEAIPLSSRYIEFDGEKFPFHADTKNTLVLPHTEKLTDQYLLTKDILSSLTLGAPLILHRDDEDTRPLKNLLKGIINSSGYMMQAMNVESKHDQDRIDQLCLNALDAMEKHNYGGPDIQSAIKSIHSRRKEAFEQEDAQKADTPRVMTDQAIVERVYQEKNHRNILLKQEENAGVGPLAVEGEFDHPFFTRIHTEVANPTGRRHVYVLENFDKLPPDLQQYITIYCGNTLAHKVGHLHLENPSPSLIIITKEPHQHKRIISKGIGLYIDADAKKYAKEKQVTLLPGKAKTEEEKDSSEYSLENLKKTAAGKSWFRFFTWFSEYASEKRPEPKVWHAFFRLDRAVHTHLLLRQPENTAELVDMLRGLVPLLAKKTSTESTKELEKVYYSIIDLLEERDEFVEKVVYSERSHMFKLLGKQPENATEEDGERLGMALDDVAPPAEVQLLGKSIGVSPLNWKKKRLTESLRAAIYELFATGNYPATASALKNTSDSFSNIRSELSQESPFYWINSLSVEDTKLLEDASRYLIASARENWKKHTFIDDKRKDFHYLEGRWEDVISKRLEELPVLFEYVVLSYILLGKQDHDVKAKMRSKLQETLLGLRDDIDPIKLLLRSEEELQLIANRKVGKKESENISESMTEPLESLPQEEPKKPVKLEYTASNMHVNPLTKAAPFLRASIQTMLPRDWDMWTDIVQPEIKRLQEDFSRMDKAPRDPYLIEYISRFTQAQLDLLTLHFHSMQGDTSIHTATEQDSFLDKDFLQRNILEMVDPVLRLIKQDKLNHHIKSLLPIETINFHLQRAVEILLIMSTMHNDQMIPHTLHVRAEFLRKYHKIDDMMWYLLLVLADGQHGEEAEKKAAVRLKVLTSFTFRNGSLPPLPPLPEKAE